MALKGYRAYREDYKDNGSEKSVILTGTYSPDFESRHTIQIWDSAALQDINIIKWVGTTLVNRSLHEIFIVNNSNSETNLTFSSDYILIDEDVYNTSGLQTLKIGPNGTAYFYATGTLVNNNLKLELRTGSQDDKKL